MLRTLALFLMLAWTQVSAHLVVLIEGDLLVAEDGSTSLTLRLTPGVLASLLGARTGPITAEAILALAPDIRRVFAAGIRLRHGGGELAPDWLGPMLEVQPGAGLVDGRVEVLLVWNVAPDSEPEIAVHLFPGETVLCSLVIQVHRDGTVGRRAIPSDVTAPPETPTEEREARAAPIAVPTGARSEAKEAWTSVAWTAVVVGFRHILPDGLDHLLFVLGLFLGCRQIKPLVLEITAFTVAHSLTLALALSGVIGGGPSYTRVVEIGIAVSIVFVASENLRRDRNPGWTTVAMVTGFGLVHGLGFAGALAGLDWGGDRFWLALVCANLGIELAQLAVVAGAVGLAAWAWRRPWYRQVVVIPLSLVIGASGLWWAITRACG